MLKSTASHRPIPTPLHQPPIYYLSKGLIGSDERWNAVEQPELLVWRVEVAQVDDEDGRKSSHRRSCANSSALPMQLVWKWLDVPYCGSEIPVSGALPPETARKTARRSAQDRPPWRRWRRRKLVPAPHQTPLSPHLCYATAVARPSDTNAGPDRDQRDHLCPPKRAGGAALRGRTIIEQLRTPDGTRHAPPVTAASTGFLE